MGADENFEGIILTVIFLDLHSPYLSDLDQAALDDAEEVQWQQIFQKIRTLTIFIDELSRHPGLINALRPPLGRLQCLKLINDRTDRVAYQGGLDNTLGPLLGLQREGDLETFLGHPTLEIIDTSKDTEDRFSTVLCRGTSVGGELRYYPCILCYLQQNIVEIVEIAAMPYIHFLCIILAIRAGAIPRLHSLFVTDNVKFDELVESLQVANPPPQLNRLWYWSKHRPSLSLVGGLLRSFPLEDFRERVRRSELSAHRDDSLDHIGFYCDRDDVRGSWRGA